MSRLLAAIMVTCAAAQLGHATAPPYSEALQLTYNTHNYVVNQMTFETPTPRQRSMVGLNSIVYGVAGVVASGVCYESAYTVEEVTIRLREMVVYNERDSVLGILKQAVEKIEPINSLVKELCNKCDNSHCDQLVDERVRCDPAQYEKPAALTLQFGQLSARYNEKIPQFELVASQHTEEQYLAKSKLALQPLITTAADSLKIFYSIS